MIRGRNKFTRGNANQSKVLLGLGAAESFAGVGFDTQLRTDPEYRGLKVRKIRDDFR